MLHAWAWFIRFRERSSSMRRSRWSIAACAAAMAAFASCVARYWAS
jgi:hypothetical protein